MVFTSNGKTLDAWEYMMLDITVTKDLGAEVSHEINVRRGEFIELWLHRGWPENQIHMQFDTWRAFHAFCNMIGDTPENREVNDFIGSVCEHVQKLAEED